MIQELENLSLIDGPLPLMVLCLGVASLLFLLFRRSLRWWIFVIVSALLAFAVSSAACWAVIHVLYVWPEDLPTPVVISVALVLWLLTLGSTTALAGLRRQRRGVVAGVSDVEVRDAEVCDAARTSQPSSPHPNTRPRRRTSPLRPTVTVLATLVALTSVGLSLNSDFGEFPTVGSLFSSPTTNLSTAAVPVVTHQLGSRFMTAGVSAGWKAPAGLPATGTVRSVDIAGTVSGFKARNAVVYLPPAYSAANRPVLPVLLLVSGQPGSPESWLRSTSLVTQLDSFAAAHGGLAPVVVMPDPNGSDQANTMCMDSALAPADTYMSVDVPHWIKTHLEADTNPAHWAVGGFSYGGTCALQMVTRHPEIYKTFMAISPEREPAVAVNRSVTVHRAFHGDTAAFNAQLPLTLLAKNKYPETSGWFAVGSQDAAYSANVRVLQEAVDKAGMSTERAAFPGGHSWAVANAALPQGLTFVFARLGLR